MTKKKARGGSKSDLKKCNDMLDALATEEEKEKETEAYGGLTERQQIIMRFKLRGLSQKAIGNFLNLSQPIISGEIKKIKKHMQTKGSVINQNEIIGETVSLYEEVEAKAWELYTQGPDTGSKAKALAIVMQAREKNVKLLMDLGKLKRSGSTSTVEVHVSPLIKNMDDKSKKDVVKAVITSQLTKLAAPRPPDDYIEADFEED